MAKTQGRSGVRNQQTARSGECFVAAELNRRGAFAVTFAGNMPKIDLIACNSDLTRTISIQVKTKRGGISWHSSIRGSGLMTEPADETRFWVLVDLGSLGDSPRYWIVPDWWMRDDIHRAHQAYLDSHGGKRARNPDSKHHAIKEDRLTEWEGRWDILGVFE